MGEEIIEITGDDDIDAFLDLTTVDVDDACSSGELCQVSEPRQPIARSSIVKALRYVGKDPDLAAAVKVARKTADADIPEPTMELPPEVLLGTPSLHACFHLKCAVDLRKVAMGSRYGEFNPRKRNVLYLRFSDPAVVVLVFTEGCVKIQGSRNTEDTIRKLARRVTRIVTKCGHPTAVCADFRFTSAVVFTDFKFPIRLKALAEKWHRHVVYVPDCHSSLVFRLQDPRCSLRVHHTGKVQVSLSGHPGLEAARAALWKVYPLLREFSR